MDPELISRFRARSAAMSWIRGPMRQH